MKIIIEHLEPELFEWSILEYKHIQKYAPLVITNVAKSEIQKAKEHLTESQIYSESIKDLTNQIPMEKIVLLDPCADKELSPEDVNQFEYVLGGGILGTDEMEGPMVDRTSALREMGFECRHLGPVQMTADTAALVSLEILNHQKPLSNLKFVDRPEFVLRKKERIEMPFRYLLDENGKPRIPDGILELWKNQDFI